MDFYRVMILRFLVFLTVLSLFSFGAEAQKGPPKGPTEVIATVVGVQDFADSVEALGTTKANETIVITADTAEKVTAIHFEDGQSVKQGDLLITLDKGEEEAALNAALASLAEAESAYERARTLQDNNALSKGTLQERLATLKQNQASVEEIKSRIEKRDIKAPFDGMLGLREVSVGALVQPGAKITTLDDLSQIKVDFDVPAVFLTSLKPGMSITGLVQAFGDRTFTGEVRTINTQVDPVTRTVTVRAVVSNADGALRPGLLMSVILKKNSRQALVIPEEALIKRGAGNFVYVVTQEQDKVIARQTQIEIGGRMPGFLEVLSGLKADEMIVVDGVVKINDGAEIVVRAVEDGTMPLRDLLKQNKGQDAVPAASEKGP